MLFFSLDSAMMEAPPTENRIRRRGTRSKRGGEKTRTFEFVTSDDTGRPPAGVRAFIRSHVMRGKNTKKRTRPRIPNQIINPWNDNKGDDPSYRTSAALTDGGASSGAKSNAWGTWLAPTGNCENISGSGMLVFMSRFQQSPTAPPKDLDLCQFAGTVDDRSGPLLWQFFTSLKEAMYPMELCFCLDNAETLWYQWLSIDSAYFNSVLFTVSAFNDVCHRSPRGGYVLDELDGTNTILAFTPQTRKYLRRTMEQLQERLYDQERQYDDITIAIIITLAMTADVVRDDAACRTHVEGLMRIVQVRGGVKAFEKNKQLQIKLLRIDLAWAMKHGSTPKFVDQGLRQCFDFRGTLLEESTIQPEPMPTMATKLSFRLSPQLQSIYADMHAFASIANRLFHGKGKLRAELYQDIMVSVQYRLLLLKYDMDRDVVKECLRLGLVAFQTSIFIINLGIRVKYEALAERMRSAIHAFRPTNEAETSLKLWALFIGAMVVFEPGDPWLARSMKDIASLLSWAEIEERLRGVMWIDMMHSYHGKRVYDGTFGRPCLSPTLSDQVAM